MLEQTETIITLKMIAYERKRKKENIRANKLQENQQKEIPLVGFNLLDLPTSIIIEILTRIPAKDVLNCRCACKTLCNLISDPPFANHFLSVSPFLSVLQHVGNDIHFVRLGGYGESAGGSSKTLKEVSTRFIPRIKNVESIGCCNGLVCFWDRTSMGKSLYITNPALGEFALLPKPVCDKYVSIKESYWFGYVSDIGCYKVVRVRIRRALLQTNPRKFYEKSEVQVLVVGSDSWKYVGDAMFPLNQKFCVDIVGGCVHWIVDDDVAKGALRLQSLNVMEDRASTFPPPPKLGSRCSFMELGVLGKILSLIECSSDYEHIEIWSMKDYGVASSWTKDFILTTTAADLELRPLPFRQHGEIIILSLCGTLLSYDPDGRKYGIISFSRESRDQIRIYVPSLLSLKHVSKGTGLRVKNV